MARGHRAGDAVIDLNRPPRPSRLTRRVHAASADAWEAEGLLRADRGGGAAAVPGARLMSSGLPHPQWNAAHVTDPANVDLAAAVAWYAARAVPWGALVAADLSWPHGRRLLHRRAMAAELRAVAPVAMPGDVAVRPARADELDAAAAVDAAAFGSDDPGPVRSWLAPKLADPTPSSMLVAVAADESGGLVGLAHGVRTSSHEGGESVGLFGVGVLPGMRRRGIGAALTAYLCFWGAATGATLGWLNPDTNEAARLYGRLGFAEVPGMDVYVDVTA